VIPKLASDSTATSASSILGDNSLLTPVTSHVLPAIGAAPQANLTAAATIPLVPIEAVEDIITQIGRVLLEELVQDNQLMAIIGASTNTTAAVGTMPHTKPGSSTNDLLLLQLKSEVLHYLNECMTIYENTESINKNFNSFSGSGLGASSSSSLGLGGLGLPTGKASGSSGSLGLGLSGSSGLTPAVLNSTMELLQNLPIYFQIEHEYLMKWWKNHLFAYPLLTHLMKRVMMIPLNTKSFQSVDFIHSNLYYSSALGAAGGSSGLGGGPLGLGFGLGTLSGLSGVRDNLLSSNTNPLLVNQSPQRHLISNRLTCNGNDLYFEQVTTLREYWAFYPNQLTTSSIVAPSALTAATGVPGTAAGTVTLASSANTNAAGGASLGGVKPSNVP
jgi:hypothetical protein